MTGLLISIRNETELAALPRNSVAIVDVKEPRDGSLGQASPERWQQIARQLNSDAELSLALGELRDWDSDVVCNFPAETRFAKVGLAGLADQDWKKPWLDLRAALLHDGIELVLVAYADSELCNAPDKDCILQFAASHQCRTVLVDTFLKNGTSLFGHWSVTQVGQWIADLHDLGATAVLAGSLTNGDIKVLKSLDADFVAVRGAVCDESREGDLNPQRVSDLATLLRQDALSVPS